MKYKMTFEVDDNDKITKALQALSAEDAVLESATELGENLADNLSKSGETNDIKFTFLGVELIGKNNKEKR